MLGEFEKRVRRACAALRIKTLARQEFAQPCQPPTANALGGQRVGKERGEDCERLKDAGEISLRGGFDSLAILRNLLMID